MTTIDLDAVAARMHEAQSGAQQLPPLTRQHPGFDLAAAYEVAHRVHLKRLQDGDLPAGRKIGFTNANIWPQYNVHQPIWGHVYQRTLRPLSTHNGSFSLAGLAEPRIEPEIVFGLRAAPHPGASDADVLACIDWVAAGFEIVQSHFPGWQFEAPDTVADGGLHGALLLGERVPLAQLASPAQTLAAFTLDLSCGRRPVDSGRGTHVLGSPLRALAHLAGVLAGQPHLPPLRPGEVVTTGTVTGAWPVAAVQHWQAQLHGIALGDLAVQFTA